MSEDDRAESGAEPRAPEPPRWSLLQSVEEFAPVARELAASTEPVAIDVERASGIRYSERPFLVQLALRGGQALLLDPETPGRTLGDVAPMLSQIPLLFHAAGQDLPSLRMAGVWPVSVWDTELAGRLLGLPKVNLGSMVESLLGIRLTKLHSAADWSRRPLPTDWLDYAAWDVLYLHELMDVLLSRLDEAGRRPWFDAECRYLVEGPAPAPAVDPWRRLSHISTLRGGRQLGRARALWQERDDRARDHDVSPKRLLSDAAIIAAAQRDPRTPEDVLDIPGFSGPHRSRLAGNWAAAVRHADSLPTADLPPARAPRGATPPHTAWKRSDPEAAELLALARTAMTALSAELGPAPEILLKPAALRAWVWEAVAAPRRDPAEQLEQVLSAEGARRWQREVCAPVLLRALREHRARD